MANKKGQAAMEFLTTYGWAFLIIIVAVAGLSYFGVFSFGKYLPTKCSFDTKLECGTSFAIIDDSSDTGEVGATQSLQFELKNNNPQGIEISEITLIEKSLYDTAVDTVCRGIPETTEIPVGKFEDIKVDFTSDDRGNCGITDNVDQKKTFIVKVMYTTTSSDIPLVSVGEITTTVQAAAE
ncbi:MAG: hypothetical protein AB7V77_01785 [Candidatus Woesearchaeota archaeon]